MPRKQPKGMTAEKFNGLFPVGTLVRYRPILGAPEFEESKTRSEAWELGSGHTVVLIEGRAGGVSVDHLEVLGP